MQRTCKLLIIVTICLTRYGDFLRRTFQAGEESGALLTLIIEIFSMQFF